ncbi:MAG: M3 family oligoendopeptidase [Nitrospirae bacterium]|nr:M3 family oligoendopeptidase [Nitrospirota bacterium]
MKRTVLKYRGLKPSSRKSHSESMPEQWDLSPLLKNPIEDFDVLAKDLDSLASQFEPWRERLSPDMSSQAFVDLLRLNEQIAEISSKLNAYAYLWFSEDTKNLQARAFKAKVEERLTALQNRTLFFDLWWQTVDETNAARLLETSGDFRYHLETIRRFRPHTLSEPEEKLINLKEITGRSAINTLYDVFTNSFTYTLTVSGKRKTLTREQLSAYIHSHRPRLREAAYKELYRVFAANHDLLGEIYATLVKDWKNENLELRKFSTPIAARNLGNDVPDEAVNALLTVCSKNASIFQEYFRIKGRICNIKQMNRYHIYAPHRAERKRYRYQMAVPMVLDAYRAFSPRLAELAERVFQERHIDARTRPGKMTGAYSYSVVPGSTPYVLLNYTGEARDVATLAHELGHAVHGMMAADHSVLTFHPTLPLAETASVFGERVLSDALMAQETNKGVKQGLLLAQLDDIYATVLRQAYFVLFEKAAHEMIAGDATVEDLAATYLTNLRQQFGDAVEVHDEFRWEWLTIPHIFGSPFYCYAYSFGNLLVLALYHKYKEQGQAFVPKYLDMLAAGGSKSPDAILADVGVDMRSEAFWQSGFDTIRSMVEELERTAS